MSTFRSLALLLLAVPAPTAAQVSASRRTARLVEPRQSPVERTIGQSGVCCSPGEVLDCLQHSGGYACFGRCGIAPDLLFCRMAALDACLRHSGGDACYQTHCGGSFSEGPFHPRSGALGLVPLPDSGVGFEPYGELRYGRPMVVERVQELAGRIFRDTGYPVYVGDLSNRDGGNSGRHAGHWGGWDVDLAVMGNTPAIVCGTFREPCYKRQAMRALIREILEMGGAARLYFNDPVLLDEFPALSRVYGHDDHLNVEWSR